MGGGLIRRGGRGESSPGTLARISRQGKLRNQQEITIEDVGGTAVYLASDLSGKTTGEVIFVDSGYNILGMTGLD